uniref:Uncharacterized protein n=1 Tax=Trichogramma kaykai TaxID=54128 RepID=A0ABD2WVB1_9HYME
MLTLRSADRSALSKQPHLEIEQMLTQQGKEFNDFDEAEKDKPFQEQDQENNTILLGHEGSDSGGYANFIF